MKKCGRCKISKELTNFYNRPTKNGSVRYAPECKGCHKDRMRENYLNNEERYKNKAKESRQRMRKFIIEQKNLPCKDCGVSYPHYVMDFHHLGHEKKSFNLSTWRNESKDSVIKEIAKCELICANCHRKRTWEHIYLL